MPLGQFVQAEAEPVVKVPIAHCKQYPKPSCGEYVPAGHPKQAAEDVAPIVGLNVPAGHRVQDTVWALAVYDPYGHGSQAAAPCSKGVLDDGFRKRRGAKYPAKQCVHVAAPAPEADPAGQARHASTELAPGSLEWEPAGQFTQEGDPPVLNDEYVPAEHIVHAF